MLCRYRGIYIFYNKFFILTYELALAASISWVNIINLFFKFVYVFSSFKIKRYSSYRKILCLFDVNLHRRDFVYFSFNGDWVLRFGIVYGDIVNYTNKVCCIFYSWSTTVDWIVNTLFCNRVPNFWLSFCCLQDLPWGLEGDCNGISFLSYSWCIHRGVNIVC